MSWSRHRAFSTWTGSCAILGGPYKGSFTVWAPHAGISICRQAAITNRGDCSLLGSSCSSWQAPNYFPRIYPGGPKTKAQQPANSAESYIPRSTRVAHTKLRSLTLQTRNWKPRSSKAEIVFQTARNQRIHCLMRCVS